MAKKKTKPAAKKAAPAKKQTKSAAKSSKSATVQPASGGERVELGMLAARPALDGASRDAFRSQCSEARAETYGNETKSASVLAEARAWCVIIDRTQRELPAGHSLRYGAERLTWLLECIAALADLIESESGRASTRTGAVGSVGVAVERVRAARNDLLLALDEIADGNDVLTADLGVARGDSGTAPELLTSLRNLVDLATRWASSLDPVVITLVRSTSLRAPDIDRARSAAEALADAIGGKTLAQARVGKDSAAVNRLEGRVLFEMGKAMRPLNAAAVQGIGQRLTPGPGTRGVLANTSKASDKPVKPAATA